MRLLKNKKFIYLALGILGVLLVMAITRPLAVEEQVRFFEEADQKTDKIDLTIDQIGSSRFFNCLDVCNSVQVKFSSEPMLAEAFYSSMDMILSEKFVKKYEYTGKVFYNPADERNCELIKAVKNIDYFGTCNSVEPFWQISGGIAYQSIDSKLADCNVITVFFKGNNFYENKESFEKEEFNGSIECNRNAPVDSFNNSRSLEPLSCINYNVCFDEQTEVKSY